MPQEQNLEHTGSQLAETAAEPEVMEGLVQLYLVEHVP